MIIRETLFPLAVVVVAVCHRHHCRLFISTADLGISSYASYGEFTCTSGMPCFRISILGALQRQVNLGDILNEKMFVFGSLLTLWRASQRARARALISIVFRQLRVFGGCEASAIMCVCFFSHLVSSAHYFSRWRQKKSSRRNAIKYIRNLAFHLNLFHILFVAFFRFCLLSEERANPFRLLCSCFTAFEPSMDFLGAARRLHIRFMRNKKLSISTNYFHSLVSSFVHSFFALHFRQSSSPGLLAGGAVVVAIVS